MTKRQCKHKKQNVMYSLRVNKVKVNYQLHKSHYKIHNSNSGEKYISIFPFSSLALYMGGVNLSPPRTVTQSYQGQPNLPNLIHKQIIYQDLKNIKIFHVLIFHKNRTNGFSLINISKTGGVNLLPPLGWVLQSRTSACLGLTSNVKSSTGRNGSSHLGISQRM